MAADVPSGLLEPLKMNDSKFLPWYTPQEMLEMGVFGGAFFFSYASQKHLPENLFLGTSVEKWSSGEPVAETNFYGVIATKRNRTVGGANQVDRSMHPYGWFQWYCQYFYGVEMPLWVNIYRIQQWKEEIVTFSHYIEAGNYVPPDPNPNGYNKYTDPAFLPQWKQHMIQFAWDPVQRPIDWGIR